MNAVHIWTPGRDQALRDLWGRGVSARVIAKQFGWSKNVILARRKRLNLTARPAPITSASWAPEEDETVRRLYADGYSCAMIALQIPGRTKLAVDGRIKKLDLPSRGYPTIFTKAARAATRPPRPTFDPNRVYDDPVTNKPCQFIAGEPSRHDDCKCCKPTKVNSPYCPAHHYLCYRETPQREPNHVVIKTGILSTRFA